MKRPRQGVAIQAAKDMNDLIKRTADELMVTREKAIEAIGFVPQHILNDYLQERKQLRAIERRS